MLRVTNTRSSKAEGMMLLLMTDCAAGAGDTHTDTHTHTDASMVSERVMRTQRHSLASGTHATHARTTRVADSAARAERTHASTGSRGTHARGGRPWRHARAMRRHSHSDTGGGAAGEKEEGTYILSTEENDAIEPEPCCPRQKGTGD